MKRTHLLPPVMLLLLAAWTSAGTGDLDRWGLVGVEAWGEVTANGLSSGPLEDVVVGGAAHWWVSFDATGYEEMVPGQLWKYPLLSGTFIFEAQGGSISGGVSGDQFMLVLNDYGEDGLWWASEDEIGWGYDYDFRVRDFSGSVFPTPDLCELEGTYYPDDFDTVIWNVNGLLTVSMDSLYVTPVMALERVSWAGIKAVFD